MRIYASIFETGSPYAESVWRRSRGALWGIGPHALSILVPALGPVTHVVSALLTERHGRWHHPCDVRFGRDVVSILQATDVFLQRSLDSRSQPVG